MHIKKRGLLVSKRAGVDETLSFHIAEMIFFAIFAFLMFSFVRNIATDNTFQRNYLSRDLSLTLDAAYAAPSELFYIYPYTPLNLSEFEVSIESNMVTIKDSGDSTKGTSYWFAGLSKEELSAPDLSGIDTIIINKSGQEPLGIINIYTRLQNGIE